MSDDRHFTLNNVANPFDDSSGPPNRLAYTAGSIGFVDMFHVFLSRMIPPGKVVRVERAIYLHPNDVQRWARQLRRRRARAGRPRRQAVSVPPMGIADVLAERGRCVRRWRNE